jgi:putative ABC transport system permease protein
LSLSVLIWAGLMRRPGRTVLTLLSIIVAFLLFGLLRSVGAAFSERIEIAGVDRLIVSPRYSIVDPLPIAHRNVIAQIEGVSAVTHADWFGGFYQDRRNFFPKYPVTPREYFSLFPEYRIPAAELDAFARTRTGAVAPKTLMATYGWKIGDRIPIEGDIWPKRDGDRRWEFELVGAYEAPGADRQPGEFLINYAYFDEARQFGTGGVGWFIVRVVDPAQAAEVARAIDAAFDNSPNATRTSTEADFARQFANQIGDIGLLMTGILSAVFFTIVLLTGNTLTQALRERIPELAVLKTLGFPDLTVALVVLGEAIALTATGGALGLGLALVAEPALARGLGSVIPTFDISATTLASGMVLALLLGVLVGAIPAWQARRLEIISALRQI